MFIRGKLYHYALESLLLKIEQKGKVKIREMESNHVVDYETQDRQVKLCFTPDVVISKDNKTILIGTNSGIFITFI